MLIDFLINRARSFIFSTAPVPAAAAVAAAAIQFVQSKPGKVRRDLLWLRVKQANSKLKNQNSKLLSAIIPVILGDESTAVSAAAHLREQGIFIPAIRYPTVARGAARLRVTLTASHSADDVATMSRALEQIANQNRNS
jgi:7-keto-8-aminopelargonate synthetase-like enzyme